MKDAHDLVANRLKRMQFANQIPAERTDDTEHVHRNEAHARPAKLYCHHRQNQTIRVSQELHNLRSDNSRGFVHSSGLQNHIRHAAQHSARWGRQGSIHLSAVQYFLLHDPNEDVN